MTERPHTRNSGASHPASVILADAEWVFRAGLAVALEGMSGMQIAASVGSSSEVKASLHALRAPGLLVCGFILSCGRDAVNVSRELGETSSGTKLLLLAPECALPFLRPVSSGPIPTGILPRTASREELRKAIRVLLRGKPQSPLDFPQKFPRADSTAAQVAFARLTGREREILRLLGRYQSHKDIASILGISPRTVESHAARLRSKLGASSARALVLLAASAALWEETGTDYLT